MEKQIDIIEEPIDIIVRKKRGPKPKIKAPTDEIIEKKRRGKNRHRMDQFQMQNTLKNIIILFCQIQLDAIFVIVVLVFKN